ncbi:MAG: transcriptional repressor [Candidatus Obscuribacterales bacterium]|nr:transcriptional repressor [Candidatus Obscuribacterales bacterium]
MERNTLQRRAILKALDYENRPLAVQELLDLASKDCPSLGIATVYRNVKTLLLEGRLKQVDMPGGAVLYEKPGIHHHHHFSCKSCQKVFDIFECALNLSKLLPEGFMLEEHEILLSGVCGNCSGSKANSATQEKSMLEGKSIAVSIDTKNSSAN